MMSTMKTNTNTIASSTNTSSNSNSNSNFVVHKNTHLPRLRCVANYQQFSPQALACHVHYNNYKSSSTTTSTTASTLIALGSHLGVLLCTSNLPQEPLLVLHHHPNTSTYNNSPTTIHSTNHYTTANVNTSNSISNLVFQPSSNSPTTTHHLYLAASRKSSILVWDVSGHSVSPLLGRLSTSTATSATTTIHDYTKNDYNHHNDYIQDLKWRSTSPSTSNSSSNSISSSYDSIVTCCNTWVGIWDLRVWNTRMRPSSRILLHPTSSTNTTNTTMNTVNTTSIVYPNDITSRGFVSLALPHQGVGLGSFVKSNDETFTTHHNHTNSSSSSIDHHIATMSRDGIVRIYDDRNITCSSSFISKSSSSSFHHQPLHIFRAHPYGGLGIEYFNHHDALSSSYNNTTTDTNEGSSSSSSSSSINNGYRIMTWGLDIPSPHDDNTTINHNYDSNINKQTNIKFWKESSLHPKGSDVDGVGGDQSSSDKVVTDSDNHNTMAEYIPTQSSSTTSNFSCTANIPIHNFACTRITPPPFENAIITIQSPTTSTSTTSSKHDDNIRKLSSSDVAIGSCKVDLFMIHEQDKIPEKEDEDDNDDLLVKKEAEGQQFHQQQYEENIGINPHTTTSTLPTPSSSTVNAISIVKQFGVNHLTTFQSGSGSDTLAFSQFMTGLWGSNRGTFHHKEDNIQPHNIFITAAELGIGPSSLLPSSSQSQFDDEHYDERYSDEELILCCLSSNGYLTIHAIPEAFKCQRHRNTQISRFTPPPSDKLKEHSHRADPKTISRIKYGSEDNLQNIQNSSNNNSKGVPKTHSDPDLVATKVSKDGVDSGMEYDHTLKKSRGLSDTDLIESTKDSLKVSFNVSSQGITYDPFAFLSRGTVEGSIMQFDLDDMMDPLESEHLSKVVKDGESMLILEDQVANNAPEPISEKKARQVPCPRLCGATFDINGCLVIFKNGDVGKMWSWFQSDLQSRSLRAGEVVTSTTSMHITEDLDDDDMGYGINLSNDSKTEVKETRNFPRNLLDLLNMNEAAKVAQWGADESEYSQDSDSSSQSLSSEEDYSDDDSTDVSNDSRLFLSKGLSSNTNRSNVEKNQAEILYQNYFGKAMQSLVLPEAEQTDEIPIQKSISVKKESSEPTPMTDFVTGQLPSAVFFTRQYSNMVLNGQCSELASKWRIDSIKSKIHCDYDFDDMRMNSFEANLKELKRSKSLIHPTYNDSHDRQSALDLGIGNTQSKDETKQSMIGNIRKLFYKNKKNSLVVGVPLDQEVMERNKGSFSEDSPSTRQQDEVNITTVSPSPAMTLNFYTRQKWTQAKDICIHNSQVAFDLGQFEKADVWTLIAQIVDNILAGEYDDYDGWNGFAGGALGRDLIQNILRYYESLGDVQMLASIVCVLGVGSYRNKQLSTSNSITTSSPLDQLLPDDYRRYDTYLHLYSSLLYNWGLLTLRAQLNKHLTYNPMREEQGQTSKNSLTFAPWCPRCDRPAADQGKNLCKICNDYAFRCSICAIAVRGLFTVCMSCGHGGHVEHIMPWFSKCNKCPLGCGCSCIILNTYYNK